MVYSNRNKWRQYIIKIIKATLIMKYLTIGKFTVCFFFTFTTLWAFSTDTKLIFFALKIGINISYKSLGDNFMKWQSFFLGKIGTIFQNCVQFFYPASGSLTKSPKRKIV